MNEKQIQTKDSNYSIFYSAHYLYVVCSPTTTCMQYDIVLIIILILKTEEPTDTNRQLSIMVYFRRLRINEQTNTATIIVTDKPISQKQNTLAGFKVGTRVGNNITFGVLSLIDPETNQVMNASHPTIKALQKKLNQGDEMPNFKLSDNPVVDINTGEETSLKWVESV